MTEHGLVDLNREESAALQAVMQDTQRAVSDYYASTAWGEDLGRHVRAFLVGAQQISDLLTNQVTDKAAFQAVMEETSPNHEGRDLLLGIKYIRNVQQHLLHVVKPSDSVRLIGGQLGFRVYASWDVVPPDVHAKLRPSTQALKPHYESALCGKDVADTMMATLRFFNSVAPSMAHRDVRGEWTGFPLLSQPGVAMPLHPEEPEEREAAFEWLSSRLPGGDARIVCGQRSHDGVPYLYGHTFVGKYSFAPFVETVSQTRLDITRGFSYLTPVREGQLKDVSEQFAEARQGSVIQSVGDLAEWADPFDATVDHDDWGPHLECKEWDSMVAIEMPGMPEVWRFEVRRARRLNALVPPGTRR